MIRALLACGLGLTFVGLVAYLSVRMSTSETRFRCREHDLEEQVKFWSRGRPPNQEDV